MTGQSFRLRPWGGAAGNPNLRITGRLTRRGGRLGVSYALQGQLSRVVIPDPVVPPARRDGLWEETCFEFFLGPAGSPRYWEFNLSPAGHWNVYRFENYRQGLTAEGGLAALPFAVEKTGDSWRLNLEVDLSRIMIGSGETWEVGVAAVIKLAKGKTTYWALHHSGPKPDFHRRESFIIVV